MRLVSVAFVVLLASVPFAPAASQTWPTGQVRIIAPSPPGSPRDIRARWVADKLTPALGQTVIVENRAGAGGSIAMEAAARSAPDGHTLVIVDPGTLAQNPHMYARTGYNALTDFAPVIQLVDSILLLTVHPQLPASTLAELIQLAKARPGQLSYGSAGIGTPPHLAAELFRSMAGIDVVHVPYKGAAPATVDLLAGRIAYTIDSPAMGMQHVATGRLRALGVTGSKRAAGIPDVPTIAEAGLTGYEYRSWMGIAVPAGTPRPIVMRLNIVLAAALRDPEAVKWFAAQGGEVVGNSPEAFAEIIRADYERWGRVIREAGIRAE